jgi:hypothetical protein
MKISKSTINLSLVSLLGAGGIIEAVSGFVLWFGLPHSGGGFQGGRGLRVVSQFWGLDRTAWTDLHDWAAVALIVIVIAHIAIHWKWWACIFKKAIRLGRRETCTLAVEPVEIKPE